MKIQEASVAEKPALIIVAGFSGSCYIIAPGINNPLLFSASLDGLKLIIHAMVCKQ